MVEQAKQIVAAAREALTASAGEIPASALVSEVERRIGRRLKPVEAGLYLHEARKRHMRETKQEVVSRAGKLSIATPRQSLNRRRSKNDRAIRALRSNAEEMDILISRDDLTDDVRKSLRRLREKTADTALDLQTAERKRKRSQLAP